MNIGVANSGILSRKLVSTVRVVALYKQKEQWSIQTRVIFVEVLSPIHSYSESGIANGLEPFAILQ